MEEELCWSDDDEDDDDVHLHDRENSNMQARNNGANNCGLWLVCMDLHGLAMLSHFPFFLLLCSIHTQHHKAAKCLPLINVQII